MQLADVTQDEIHPICDFCHEVVMSGKVVEAVHGASYRCICKKCANHAATLILADEVKEQYDNSECQPS